MEKTIVDAITKAYIEGKDALQGTFEQLKDLAKNTSCEDLLNPDVRMWGRALSQRSCN